MRFSSIMRRWHIAVLAAGFSGFAALPGALAQDEAKAGPIEKYVGHLLSGSGAWRAPNPDYEPGSAEPAQFGMNYKWGPYRQHVTGEIVSIYEDGKTEKNWSLFLTYNPVTGRAWLEQTGASGVYFRGELEMADNGRRTESGLIFIPNGTVKSVRDEVEIIDENTRISHVFERDERGGWKEVRSWTWRQTR